MGLGGLVVSTAEGTASDAIVACVAGIVISSDGRTMLMLFFSTR